MLDPRRCALGLIFVAAMPAACSSRKTSSGAESAPNGGVQGAGAAKAAPKDAMYVLGETVFNQKAQPACATCHVLQAAGSQGTVGPNLDTLVKTKAQIIQAVTGGLGLMPAQGEVLSKKEIEAVAHYIVQARKGP